MIRKKIYIVCVVWFLFSCGNQKKDEPAFNKVDYLMVKEILDTINNRMQLELDSTGTYTIPYTDLKKGKKHLIFFGASHTHDLNNPQFAEIEEAFNQMKPEIAFNEGGQIDEKKVYKSRDSAIVGDGERGLLKFLCDQSGIKMMNGDMDDKEEFAALQKRIPKDKIYLYMAIERFFNPYRSGRLGTEKMDEAFQKKFLPYLDKSGLELKGEERTIHYLKNLYRKYFKKEFDLDTMEEVHEFYLSDKGEFGSIGRATKEIRDDALLRKIDEALDKTDRVFVVFGGSHRVAVEPALKQIIEKNR